MKTSRHLRDTDSCARIQVGHLKKKKKRLHKSDVEISSLIICIDVRDSSCVSLLLFNVHYFKLIRHIWNMGAHRLVDAYAVNMKIKCVACVISGDQTCSQNTVYESTYVIE